MESGLGATGGGGVGYADAFAGGGGGGFTGPPAAHMGGPMPSTPWYNQLSNVDMTKRLQQGVMLNYLTNSLFSGTPSSGPPPTATLPQVGSRSAAQPTALQQLAYLQAQQNARRNKPGMFG